MDPGQFDKLLATIDHLAKSLPKQQPYTITGASDWPILIVMATGVVCLIVYMWHDLKSTIRDQRSEERIAREKNVDALWQAMRDCRAECVRKLDTKP